jgi:hypothetical protein
MGVSEFDNGPWTKGRMPKIPALSAEEEGAVKIIYG